MRIQYGNFLAISLMLFIALGVAHAGNSIEDQSFYSSITTLNPTLQESVIKHTWHSGCPLSTNRLRSLTITYWGFDGRSHQGTLIVHQDVAVELKTIFKKLYTVHFPMTEVKPIHEYQGNDLVSMEHNNTSAFNCRSRTGDPNRFSIHSYGTAIDINPMLNPYVKNGTVLPPGGRSYLDRSRPLEGMIAKNDYITQLFKQAGWDWGGNWKNHKDYQHFQKKLTSNSQSKTQ